MLSINIAAVFPLQNYQYGLSRAAGASLLFEIEIGCAEWRSLFRFVIFEYIII